MPDARLTDFDRRWLRRALRLAVASAGATAPNPGVGCVLAAGEALLGQGRHRRDGGPHAEIEALTDSRAAGADLRRATAYVTLAPCTRPGRTGACSRALIEAGVARVVAALADPMQDDPGPTFTAAGIEYLLADGPEAAAAARLHGGFLTRAQHGRPRLTGKWAMSLDGYLAAAGGHSAWISSPTALAASRRRRRVFDGILIGAGTARRDDPRLAALAGPPRSPRRIILAADAEIEAAAALLREVAELPLWVLHDLAAPTAAVAALAARGCRMLALPDSRDPLAVARRLGEEGLNDVLVEGGAGVHRRFLQAGLYDRLELYQAGKILGGGLSVAGCEGLTTIPAQPQWELEEAPRLVEGCLCTRWRRLPEDADALSAG